jgi:hypothetical protein
VRGIQLRMEAMDRERRSSWFTRARVLLSWGEESEELHLACGEMAWGGSGGHQEG